jgi:hypothetical protein
LTADAAPFQRGDTDANGKLEITDGIRVFGFLFLGAPQALDCDDAADTNDSGRLDISDGIYILSFLFSGGAEPPPPFADCGLDPSEDDLNCALFPLCAVPLSIEIASPTAQSVTAAAAVDVTGTVSGIGVSVDVNGVAAQVVGGAFTAPAVPLAEGTNLVVATARDVSGQTASDSLSVRRDTDPPLVVIETPGDGARVILESVPVAGTVNDVIPGATVNDDDVTVTVNDMPAAVNNRTFFVSAVPLVLGKNTISATAVDRAGNRRTTEIRVTREKDLAGVQIMIAGGNAQRAPISTTLPVPIEVRLATSGGKPVASRPVSFQVSRGDGLLGDPAAGLRNVTVLTDAGGEAAVVFTLGTRTGEGFHRVLATTPGSLTSAEFCATALPAPPATISIVLMPPRRAAAATEISDPLQVIVTDAGGNPVPGVPVTFRVETGGGHFRGQPTAGAVTDMDGIARAFWTLGPEPGTDNNEASANFEGSAVFPATFTVSGVAPGTKGDTTVSGIVQDSTTKPIVGARAVIRGTELEAFTGPDGVFTIHGVPPGGRRIGVLGSVASDPARGVFFPDIDYAIQVVAGADNQLDQIVILPFLDTANARVVGGAQDVVLTMEGVPGFAIKVFAGSVLLADGTRGEALVSSSQVKFDKVPMPPPQGATSIIVGTLQPPGIRFDPPAQVSYPNVEGFAPGDVADIFAFHHDIGQFVNIGPGTVSEDGSVVVSDPGFGILETGWHCLIRIPGPTANCANNCMARLEWQTVRMDGSLGPVMMTAPVTLACADAANGGKARVRVTFSPGGGSFDSVNWTGAAGVMLSEQSTSGTTAMVTVMAAGQFGPLTIRSPIYRIPVPGQADKTCQAEVGVEPGDIVFLDAAMNRTTFANVAKWETGFNAGPAARADVNARDADRFLVEITDPARRGMGGNRAMIRATLRTRTAANATADTVENFMLTETAAGSGVFRSDPFILVSNQVDDQFTAAGVADGNARDPTLNIFRPADLTGDPLAIQVGGTVRVDYNPSNGMGPTGGADGECHARINVCRESMIRTKTLRPFILRTAAGGAAVTTDSEVREDFALMNVVWSQCCIRVVGGGSIQTVDPPAAETFMNVGFDHDGNPATADINPTAGFDFVDANMNNLHDRGERSEPFTDANGNGGYDFGVNLADGSLDEFATAGALSLIPTREERSLLDSFADGNNRTVEYFVVNALSMGSRGEAFIPAVPMQAANLRTTNMLIVQQPAVGIGGAAARDFVNAAHELGHVFLNDGSHTPRGTTAGRVNVMVGGGTDAADGVNNSKRLTTAQCTTARGF